MKRIFGFPSSLRIKGRKEFMWLSQKGKVLATECFVVHWMMTSRIHSRLGITVSARCGSSVERNLFRRRAREAFRHSQLRKMKGVDINLRAKKGKVPSFEEFCGILQRLFTLISAGPGVQAP